MEKQDQIQNYSQQQQIVKLEETLSLSKSIIEGQANMPSIEMGLSVNDTFSKPNIRSVFKKQYGPVGYSVVNVLVTRFIDSFGFSTKLNPTQIETLTVDILESFAYESLEDIILFLKMARTGKFGSTGRGVDSNLILGDWFPKYLDIKAQIREENYEKEKNQRNAKKTGIEVIMKVYNKQKPFEQRVSEYVDKITQDYDRQMLEDLIVDWEKDPDRSPYVSILKQKRKSIK